MVAGVQFGQRCVDQSLVVPCGCLFVPFEAHKILKVCCVVYLFFTKSSWYSTEVLYGFLTAFRSTGLDGINWTRRTPGTSGRHIGTAGIYIGRIPAGILPM
jgi:hypothetical protein